MNTVVGWATAKSPAAGCGADHDRMTSLLSRSSTRRRAAGDTGSEHGVAMSL
jgi:hypothetical protein